MLKITLIAVGDKMPPWVSQAVSELSKRLQEGFALTILEIPLQRRGKASDLSRILDKEMAMINNAIPIGSKRIALDRNGETFNSEQLAKRLEKLQQTTSHLCFLIGGPEGIQEPMLNECEEKWSLSSLTLPHTLARILFLEAIYRAWAILNNHPYHK